MTDIEKNYYQIDNRKYLEEEYGRELWVQVCGSQVMNGAKAEFWCGLIDKGNIKCVFQDCDWDISCASSAPGFEENGSEYVYRSNFLENGLEPLLHYREFYGVRSDFVDISQEFVLLNNLYYDTKTNSYWTVLNSGETEEVVRYTDDKKTYMLNQNI